MEAGRLPTEVKARYGWVSLLVFANPASAAELVRRVLLPVLFAQRHAGHGAARKARSAMVSRSSPRTLREDSLLRLVGSGVSWWRDRRPRSVTSSGSE